MEKTMILSAGHKLFTVKFPAHFKGLIKILPCVSKITSQQVSPWEFAFILPIHDMKIDITGISQKMNFDCWRPHVSVMGTLIFQSNTCCLWRLLYVFRCFESNFKVTKWNKKLKEDHLSDVHFKFYLELRIKKMDELVIICDII